MAAERDSLAREMEARHEAAQRVREAGEHRRIDERQRAEKELREVELELAAVAPDAPALLDGFDAWGQAPDRWLGEAKVSERRSAAAAGAAVRRAARRTLDRSERSPALDGYDGSTCAGVDLRRARSPPHGAAPADARGRSQVAWSPVSESAPARSAASSRSAMLVSAAGDLQQVLGDGEVALGAAQAPACSSSPVSSLDRGLRRVAGALGRGDVDRVDAARPSRPARRPCRPAP